MNFGRPCSIRRKKAPSSLPFPGDLLQSMRFKLIYMFIYWAGSIFCMFGRRAYSIRLCNADEICYHIGKANNWTSLKFNFQRKLLKGLLWIKLSISGVASEPTEQIPGKREVSLFTQLPKKHSSLSEWRQNQTLVDPQCNVRVFFFPTGEIKA